MFAQLCADLPWTRHLSQVWRMRGPNAATVSNMRITCTADGSRAGRVLSCRGLWRLAVRVLIESDPDFISVVTGEFVAEPDAEVMPADSGSDLTEQKFGFAEAAAVVAIVKGVAEIAEIVKRIANRSIKKQTLRLKSALGSVVIEVSPDITVAELQALLAPLSQLP